MPIQIRKFLAPAIAALSIVGCGEEQAVPDDIAMVTVPVTIDLPAAPCQPSVHDFGSQLYVIMSGDCALADAQQLTIVEHGATGVRHYEVTFPGWNSATQVQFVELGAREVTFFRAGSWREIPNQNSWGARDGAGLLLKDGYAYLLGGWLHDPVTNEVWRSRNLIDWEFLGFAPWPARHGSAWLVHHDRLFVISGDMYDDVWSSPDGIEWRQENAAAPFGKRYTPNAVSKDGRIILYAGIRWHPDDWCARGQLECSVEGFNDVWESRDDGRTWQRVVEHAPWPGRGLIHGSILHNGEIFLIGGGLKLIQNGAQYSETSAEMTDIWSSPDGRTWTQRSATLPFPARTHLSVAETSFGCVVSDGSVGLQNNVSNNLYFASDCVNFVEVENRPHPARHASAVTEFNGTLVILGGPPAGGAGTAIWQYIPSRPATPLK